MYKLSSADTALLLRLASSLPVGDESRRAILSSLSGKTSAEKQTWKCVGGPKEGTSVSFSVKADVSKDEDEQFVKAFQAATKLKLENGDPTSTTVETKDGSEWELQGGKKACGEGCLELPGDTMAPDVWDPIMPGFSQQGNAIDRQIQASAMGAEFERVRELTDKVRGAKALSLPVAAGTRVTFAGHFGSIFAYENPPKKDATGEVVTVRSATGDVTAHDGMVFVKWADGQFLPVHAEHLRLCGSKPPKVARTFTAREIPAEVNRFKVAGLGDISQFLSKVSSDTLVHKSQKDLWSFTKGADGGLTVQRLFSSNGEALKG